MNVADLISRVGPENIDVDFLDTNFTRSKAKPGETTITFKTGQPMSSKGTEKMGVILWLDREDVQKAVAAETPTEVSEVTDEGSS